MNERSGDGRGDVPPTTTAETTAAETTAADDADAPVSRRGYLLGGLGALAAVGTAGVVASQRLDVTRIASRPAPSTALQPARAGVPAADDDPAVDDDSAVGLPDLPVGDPAPAVQPTGWLNTRPLTSASLAAHVVLYYFWTFECINCQHVQPYVKAWHARYAGDGLIVLSIHTPEFSVEADPKNVADYVATNHIRYPVALDPTSRVWRAFGNRYWPAFYLHDRAGRRRLTHFGEGNYSETEDAVRQLLGVSAGSPRAVPA